MMTQDTQPLSGAGGQGRVDVGPLVHVSFAPSRLLWRIGPAWAVVAGAAVAGLTLTTSFAWLRLVAAIVLADLLWGALRRIIPDPSAWEGTEAAAAPSLPYGRSDAPLARFLQTIATGQHASATPWLGWLSGLALATVLSLLLGAPVLVLSALAVGLMLLALALYRRGRRPAMCLALLDVGLPWLVGGALVLPATGETASWLPQVGWLAAAFTALQWSIHRARFSGGRRSLSLWSAQALVLAILVFLRQPGAAAVAALLLAPPAWWLAGAGASEDTLRRSLPWWWAAMLATAAIVRAA
jgi:hypothetical protein